MIRNAQDIVKLLKQYGIERSKTVVDNKNGTVYISMLNVQNHIARFALAQQKPININFVFKELKSTECVFIKHVVKHL